MKAAEVFNPRMVVGLIAAGVLAFAAMLLLMAYGAGANPQGSRDGRAHALSTAATGFKGLVTLIDAFHDTRIVRHDRGIQSENLLVVALEPGTDADAVGELLDQRRGRATLIILPKWLTIDDPARRGWVRAVGPIAGRSAQGVLAGADVAVVEGDAPSPAFAPGDDILSGLRIPVPRSPQTVSGKNLQRLVGRAGGRALIARIGDQPHYVVADPDLLNNHGLRNPTTARTAVAMIQRMNATGATGVDFDVTLNGFGSSESSGSVLRMAFEPPFLAMTLALLAAALLAGLHGAWRFGPARREERAIALGKAALVENSAGLLRLANREAHLGGAYADVVRQEAARITAAPHWLQGEDLDRYLDRMTRRGEPSFAELAGRLASARHRHAVMAAARALFAWKKGIIR